MAEVISHQTSQKRSLPSELRKVTWHTGQTKLANFTLLKVLLRGDVNQTEIISMMHSPCSFTIYINKALRAVDVFCFLMCWRRLVGYQSFTALFQWNNYSLNINSSHLLLSIYIVPRDLTNNYFTNTWTGLSTRHSFKYSANINSRNSHYVISKSLCHSPFPDKENKKREVRQCLQGQYASKWQCQNSFPSGLLLTYYIVLPPCLK